MNRRVDVITGSTGVFPAFAEMNRYEGLATREGVGPCGARGDHPLQQC